jgi:hypothetical protein
LHARLLQLLAENPPRQIVLSLEGVARFAATWAATRKSADPQTREDAPLMALAELDVAWDSELLGTDSGTLEGLRDNLLRAFRDTQHVLALEERDLARLERKSAAASDAARPKFDGLLDAIRAAQRGATPDRLRGIRLDHFRLLG